MSHKFGKIISNSKLSGKGDVVCGVGVLGSGGGQPGGGWPFHEEINEGYKCQAGAEF